jgi:hypothetical protein
MTNNFGGTSVRNKRFLWPSKDFCDKEVEGFHVVELPEKVDPTPPFDPLEVEPVISLNSLTSFSTPQTLKLIGYIKHHKVIILIDSGSTHNFIHHRIT